MTNLKMTPRLRLHPYSENPHYAHVSVVLTLVVSVNSATTKTNGSRRIHALRHGEVVSCSTSPTSSEQLQRNVTFSSQYDAQLRRRRRRRPEDGSSSTSKIDPIKSRRQVLTSSAARPGPGPSSPARPGLAGLTGLSRR